MDDENSRSDEGASDASGDDDRHSSRLQLVLDVFVFQFKLAADGLRDVLLSPLSILSAIMGLIAGGDDPYRYFRDLLRFGRRTEVWINLFGHRKRSGTSDELIAPIKRKVMAEAQANSWISKAGGELNKTLDRVSERVNPGEQNQNKDQERTDKPGS